MKLKVLGSSSKGNGYILDNGTEALQIEAGLSISETKKILDFGISRLKGVLVSHQHGDHCARAKDFLKNYIPVFTNGDTAEYLRTQSKNIISLKQFEHNKEFHIGNFKVLPFELKHDVECSGFLINHKEMGNLLFVTDTIYIPYTFKNLSHILIEANYSEDIFNEKADLSGFVNKRTITGHLNIDTTIEHLAKNDLSNVKEIVLIHLSDSNSNALTFKNMIEQKFGKPCYIADDGMEIELL